MSVVSGERRLVAEVGGEAGVAADPVVQPLGHRVERADDRRQVAVVGVGQPRRQVADGDPRGRAGHRVERRHHPAGRGPAEQRADHGGQRGERGQRRAQHPQRVVDVARRRHLEVRRARAAERHADHDHRLALQRRPRPAGATAVDPAHEVARHRARRLVQRGVEPGAVAPHQRGAAGRRRHLTEQVAHLAARGQQPRPYRGGVGERLPGGQPLPGVEQRVPHHQERPQRQHHRHQQRPGRVREHHRAPQPEGAAAPHERSSR
nr:hypothetical protein [Angustibacter aerolatus]